MSDLSKKIAACSRVRADVDLDAIEQNVRNMKAGLSPDTKMIAVIKTDGYGHGSIPIAHCLEPLDFLYGFAVATCEEAQILRGNGVRKPILILGYTFPETYLTLAEEEIRPAVFRRDMLPALSDAAKKAGKPVKLHIKVDTGMGRIGITPDDAGIAFVREAMEYAEDGNLVIEGIFTHFARADEKNKSHVNGQLRVFEDFLDRIETECGLKIPVKHCSNSAGILELPKANLDVVRAGITLYGLMPSDEVPCGETYLQPALSLRSHIVFIKTVHAGQSISYGGTFTAREEMRVATIPVGYGDGYPRSLSGGKGYVLIRGKRARILGRVCMDQFMVDVTGIPEAAEGDVVTLIGPDGEERITAELLGELSGRFNYELVCDINRRVPRVYHQGKTPVGIQDFDGYTGICKIWNTSVKKGNTICKYHSRMEDI